MTGGLSVSRRIEEFNLRIFFGMYVGVYHSLRFLAQMAVFFPATLLGVYAIIMLLVSATDIQFEPVFKLGNIKAIQSQVPIWMSGFTLVMFFLSNACTNFARLPELDKLVQDRFKRAAFGFMAATITGMVFLGMMYALPLPAQPFELIRGSLHGTALYLLVMKTFMVASLLALEYALWWVCHHYWMVLSGKITFKDTLEESLKAIDRDLHPLFVSLYWVVVYGSAFYILFRALEALYAARYMTGLFQLGLFLYQCSRFWQFKQVTAGQKFWGLVLMVGMVVVLYLWPRP